MQLNFKNLSADFLAKYQNFRKVLFHIYEIKI